MHLHVLATPSNLDVDGRSPRRGPDVEAAGDPEPVQAPKKAIRVADVLLIVTPEYIYGVLGVLADFD